MASFQDMTSTLSLQTRLGVAFSALCLLMFIGLGATLLQTKDADRAVRHIVEETVPVAFLGSQLATDLNASIASLRGWVLTADPRFKELRASDWQRIDAGIEKIAAFLAPSSQTNGQAKWQSLKTELIQFKQAQQDVEQIAHSDQDLPATEILNQKVTPLTDAMLSAISQVYIQEINQAATPERKRMLAEMGDVRSALAVVIGNVRAYLLTGEKHYSGQYQAVWKWALGQLDKLNKSKVILSPAQQNELTKFNTAAQQVTPLFNQIIQIRAGEDWNKARFMLLTTVTPLANSLITHLTHPQDGLVALKEREMIAAGQVAQQATRDLIQTGYILAFLGFVFGIALTWISAKSIVQPVRDMTQAMTRLAKGEINVPIPALSHKDEIGAMAKALSIFKQNAEERSRLEKEKQKDIQRQAERAHKIEELSHKFEQNIRSALAQTAAMTQEMTSSSQTLTARAQDTLQETRAADQSACATEGNVAQVAKNVAQLSASFTQINEQANHSVRAIEEAIAQGENASKIVHWMNEAASRIGEVVQMIEDIAAQTNLLALNATVEAARAGEAGKGFSVVASEVKNLANQTARATQEISDHILKMQETTDRSVHAIQDVCTTIARVGTQAGSVRDTVNQQDQATQDITHSIHQVSGHTQVINQAITAVGSAAEQTHQAAGQMQTVMQTLSQQSDQLRDEVEMFLNQLKTA